MESIKKANSRNLQNLIKIIPALCFLSITGCSTPSAKPPSPHANLTSAVRSQAPIQIDLRALRREPGDRHTLPSSDDIAGILVFAMGLALAGQPDTAAEFFEQTAFDIESRHNLLESALMLEAANALLLSANSPAAFRMLQIFDEHAPAIARALYAKDAERLRNLAAPQTE